ncbi:hypothetical protein BHU72_08905 [Desulfuribacillus stibiiarsenatis]|uniref:tRNA 5-hydroxyuridine methyltransferase n=1 Tax=Desulfuribacillus stibiiarsenatis TaxID=1390249 RepID=A0A1E5L3E3_9FIRM|nr:O-methyltransferase [Desulfuribacillus stibiiarsenatis]OEH84604.1 hypothetical protein BHU72_08905 [Desulfuribacillus stibiiarsenatis]
MIDSQLVTYIQGLQPIRKPIYTQLESIAKEEGIPIIYPETGYFLELLCKIQQPKRILEVGTAVGYSALWMLDATNAVIDTIEIDSERVKRAQQLFEENHYANRIKVHEGDAIDVLPILAQDMQYDFVFIDAAKGQYVKYFDVIDQMTSKGAIVVTDNVFFHGMVPGIVEPTKKLASLVKKIQSYNVKLQHLENWHTTFYSIGDGIAVSIKISDTND